MRRLIMPMAMSMCRITLRQLFIMHQLMAITVEVLLTLVIMVIHQEEYIVILTELTIQIMYHNLLIILKKLNLLVKIIITVEVVEMVKTDGQMKEETNFLVWEQKNLLNGDL